MNAPTFEDDGYPDEATLVAIREWDAPFEPLMLFVEDAWTYKDRIAVANGTEWTLSTGGWSGNESIIEALEQNFMFWSMCWQSSRRGGHYEFSIPKE